MLWTGWRSSVRITTQAPGHEPVEFRSGRIEHQVSEGLRTTRVEYSNEGGPTGSFRIVTDVESLGLVEAEYRPTGFLARRRALRVSEGRLLMKGWFGWDDLGPAPRPLLPPEIKEIALSFVHGPVGDTLEFAVGAPGRPGTYVVARNPRGSFRIGRRRARDKMAGLAGPGLR